MELKHNPLHYFFWIGLFFITSGTVLYCSRPTMGSLPDAEALDTKRLNPERQTVWIRVDSLRLWLDPLQNQSMAFEWQDKGDEIRFDILKPKDFDAIFFQGRPMSVFGNLKNPIIKPLKGSTGFASPVTEKNTIRLVQLPADVVQSIQLYIQNTY